LRCISEMRVQRYIFFWKLQKKSQVFYKKTQFFMESVLFWGYFRIFAIRNIHIYI